MTDKGILKDWVLQALAELGGSGTVLDVSKTIWHLHRADLETSGDLFFTWQYDMRWAAQKLRDAGALKPSQGRRPFAEWELA